MTPFARLPRNTRLLIAARAVRSVGQGALVADFALYLKALGWTGPRIGVVLMGALLFGAGLTLVVGPLSDRLGRKNFLLGYEAVQILAAASCLATTRPAFIAAAAVLGGFGRGANGAAGPFAPVEQSWLARGLAPRERGPVYSLNTAAGFLGMAAGAILAAAPDFFALWLPGPQAYRPLFLLPLAGSIACLALLAAAEDDSPQTRAWGEGTAGPVPKDTAAEPRPQYRENRLLAKLAAINALNGVGIGMVAPLIAYWFALRFGQGPASIGPVMGLSFLLAAAGALAAGRLSSRFGVVPTVVAMRLAGLVLLLGLPLASRFWLAAAFYALRAACNQGTIGARQALAVSLVSSHRRWLAATLNTLSVQIPRALGPVLTGLLFESGWFSLPFLIAAAFQGAYLFFYQQAFRSYDPARAGKAGGL